MAVTDEFDDVEPEGAFSAPAFRVRAQERLPKLPSAKVTGDHVLNPDLGPYAKWQGARRDAAVLIPVINRGSEASVLLTLRTSTLSAHAGQIALPGGKIDPEDASAEAAALREAYEEVGLTRSFIEPLGTLPPYLTGSGYRIVPVVSVVEPGFRVRPNPGEVADVFEVPLSFLMNPANHQRQSRDWNGRQRYFYAMPYGDHFIWGVTAGILRTLYETVYG